MEVELVVFGLLGLVVICSVIAAVVLLIREDRSPPLVEQSTLKPPSGPKTTVAGAATSTTSTPRRGAIARSREASSSKELLPKAGPIPKKPTPPAQKKSPSGDSTPANARLTSLKASWSNLSTPWRVAIPVMAVVFVVAIAISTFGFDTRDEGSYQYGRTALSSDARMLMSTSGPGSAVQSTEDACRIVIDSSMKVNTPQAESMRKMDPGDMLAGCVDAVNNE